ncbi:LysR family transcriptional regulator [Aestuariirhabdus sp. Z084]|uniref:LysR family transcriptional regulator n=1 Tax=Aestuariirhabdus haliotis TaxID=2918751 RepID=UPI00201B4366|nr:LysR family transcriptional regulator [Aestuariirhabdus haliotis]MCL6415734.1 LysR family transcriptional regulator [Aestuariirhabdus haliotis]MCL6419740.1 LysR family transcriptional regulator [Aestuariirhabdus haliotis]
MNLQSIDLNLLVVFDAIYGEGNMTRAADKVGISQSAMSHALKRLRTLLNDELFTRSASGMSPTLHAQEMAQAVHESLKNIAQLESDRSGFDYSQSQRGFTIVLGDYGETLILPLLLDHLRTRAPNIKLEIIPASHQQVKEGLLSGSIDIALCNRPIDAPGLSSVNALGDSLRCIMGRFAAHPQPPFTLDKYLDYDHIQLKLTHEDYPLIDQHLKQRGHQRSLAITSYSLHALPYVLQSSTAICTVPARLARYYQQKFDLYSTDSPFDFEVPCFAVWRDQQTMDPGQTWLKQVLLDCCLSLAPAH